MRGASRDSLALGRERLDDVLGGPGVDAGAVGDDLFAVTALLNRSAGLRRALTDPSRPAEAKVGIIDRLLGDRIGGPSLEVLRTLVAGRWATSTDLVDAVEELGVTALLASAERAGRLDSVEDELFRFGRTIGGDPGLRDAFSGRTVGADRKSALVHRLLDGKAAPETVVLAVQAAVAPRGLRTEQVLEQFVSAAARRREQLVAHVLAATEPTQAQRDRLGRALRGLYGRDVQLNIDVDPGLIGGMQVTVGGELIDGTVAGRLNAARRRLAG